MHRDVSPLFLAILKFAVRILNSHFRYYRSPSPLRFECRISDSKSLLPVRKGTSCDLRTFCDLRMLMCGLRTINSMKRMSSCPNFEIHITIRRGEKCFEPISSFVSQAKRVKDNRKCFARFHWQVEL